MNLNMLLLAEPHIALKLLIKQSLFTLIVAAHEIV